jgi:hypothetical protein
MQYDAPFEFQRTHLDRLKLAADVILSEGDAIGDVLEAELCVLRDRLEEVLLSLPDASSAEHRPRDCHRHAGR